MSTAAISVTPIATVHNSIPTPEDDVWGSIISAIELDASRFTPEAFLGLSDFSHIEVVFSFHHVAENQVHTSSRHPRGRKDWPKTGIFAQRGKDRPNRIGVTICRLLSVKGLTLEVQGLDAVNGTPVLDIKPYVSGFAARGEVREPAWIKELMSGYWS